MPSIHLQYLKCLKLLAAGMASSFLQATSDRSLVNRSPFLPPNNPSAVVTETKSARFPELQFVGFLGSAPDWSFALFFNPQNQVKWLSLGAEFADVKLVKFDSIAPSITVEHAGQTKTIKMAQSAPPLTQAPSGLPRNPNHNQAAAIALPGQKASKTGSKQIPRRRIILPKKNNP
tara:strand:- start:203 stop:727 length:525 start_codon:yes stop_codon:yes gene_type:complete